ncbi:site-specific DNA-methyltransferase [Salegentibacter mishustinae]|uniref:DNA methyltransferase n=1 Tax=Salegentibacter mishustinae TaxID=270918 RepID=UPI001CE177A7|nr:DNA methyltransferase [Salegentibacter mishustinae]UBZ05491.1 site-specific DNA-methyltransferase [Salegentibacter mishustinae]
MILDQEKLDVKTKKRANLFNWRGQFTPEFVEYILQSTNLKPGAFIADPFTGSGTVLIESAVLSYNSVGFEINPAAYQMAKFYEYSKLNLNERQDLLFSVANKLEVIQSQLNGQLVASDSKDYRESYKNFLEVSVRIKEACSEEDNSFFLNMLFASEKDKNLSIKKSLSKSFHFFEKALMNLPYSETNITVHNSDARLIGELYENAIDLILTSPPYINVFNYHQNHRAITESFDYNVLNVAHSEFGSNRKNRGNRLLTVVQYCLDMEASLNSFWKSLSPEGKIIMVVGRESNVRKTPFYNGNIVLELAQTMGGFKNITKNERSFSNKFGKRIIEDILIFEKDSIQKPSINNAQEIAKNHILEAKKVAPNEVQNDFEDVLKKINIVKPSPIYS